MLPLKKLLISLSFFLLPTAGAQELLPSEQAFAFKAVLNEQQIDIEWDIADDYYMYKDRIDLSIDAGAEQTGQIKLPAGKKKLDMALTGDEVELEVYTGRIHFSVPVKYTQGASITFTAHGQGCNEPVGVCYPPIKHQLVLSDATTTVAIETNNLPLANPVNQSTSILSVSDPLAIGGNVIQPMVETIDSVQPDSPTSSDTQSEELSSVEKLRDLLSTGLQEDEFLEVDDAFKVSVKAQGDNNLIIDFDIAEGYYLYREKTQLTSEGSARVADLTLPDGVIKEDPYFGKMAVFKKDFSLPVKLLRQDPSATTLTLNATYQGCADDGICYAPVNKSFTVNLPEIIGSAFAAESTTDVTEPQGNLVANLLNPGEGTPVLWILLGAFIAGIGLAFTPCVLPMIPILSSIIAGQGESLNRARGGILAMIYVAGSAVTYAAMGAIAGATGDQLQAYFQTPLAIGILCLILVVMAMSMFGLFRIQMPSFIQSSLQNKTASLGGKAPMVFILGLVSALIVGACVSPVLISFLGIAITKADPTMGAIIMILMALGMGLPLIALGFGAGHLIPRAGQWMNTVNHVFGVMLIGVAIYLLQALQSVPVLLLWGIFFIIVSIYMGATSSLPQGSSGWSRLFKGIGTVLLIWGVFALIGGFFGQRDILKPLPDNLFQASSGTSVTTEEKHIFTRVNNESELDAQLATAREQGKFVMIDYYADWCVDCVRMEKSTFQDSTVIKKIEQDFIALQVDVTDPNDNERKALKRRFGVFGPPAVLFIDQQGTQLKDRNFYGYRDTESFLAIINSL